MDYTRLGGSGLEVSRLILGCMSYGDPTRNSPDWAAAHPWALSLDDSRPFYRAAVEAGITVFDTANAYSQGASEEVTGTLIREFARRDQVVIATKLYFRAGRGPNGAGLSRGAVMTQIDASLRRLGTDYVDLYQIHRFDPEVPIEETMQALHDVVRAGKARYLGASSMAAWQFASAQHAAELNGWTPFVSMQDQYNLIMREEEREMHPFCTATGVGVIPWSPIARGRLARAWDAPATSRSEQDAPAFGRFRQDERADREILDAVGEIAGERGISRAQVALAWVLHRPAVTAPIIGATRPAQLEEALATVDIALSADEIARLERPYTPRLPEGY